MATASLVWQEGGELRVADLAYDGETLIGRSDAAAVRLAERTVSREQAVIRFDGARFVVENRSSTNPTQLAGMPVTEATPLPDAATVKVGTIELAFHNLSAGDRLSGPVCSHCGRENAAEDRDCWYCGTSLVSAATTVRQRLQVICRVVSASGEHWDLHPGRAMVLRADGTVALADPNDALEPGSLRINLEGARLMARAAADGESATVGGQVPAADGVELHTGDRIDAGAARFWVLVR
ncbi:MAG: FHA domain-containing protein [Chloroflexota bacterium]|nr:FHA domain-containing protein [Chloroflexota bacterium]